MANQAEQRSVTFASTEGTGEEVLKDMVDAAATGQKDNSRKAYFREFRKVLEHADVVLEVLDARDPLGCRTRHVERMIMDSGLNKKVILVLNKIGRWNNNWKKNGKKWARSFIIVLIYTRSGT